MTTGRRICSLQGTDSLISGYYLLHVFLPIQLMAYRQNWIPEAQPVMPVPPRHFRMPLQRYNPHPLMPVHHLLRLPSLLRFFPGLSKPVQTDASAPV